MPWQLDLGKDDMCPKPTPMSRQPSPDIRKILRGQVLVPRIRSDRNFTLSRSLRISLGQAFQATSKILTTRHDVGSASTITADHSACPGIRRLRGDMPTEEEGDKFPTIGHPTGQLSFPPPPPETQSLALRESFRQANRALSSLQAALIK